MSENAENEKPPPFDSLVGIPASPIPAHATAMKLPDIPPQPSTPIPSPESSSVEEDTTSDSEAEVQFRLSTLMPLFVFLVIYVGIIVVFAMNHAVIIPLLQRFTMWARSYGWVGYVCVGLMTFLTAIPPVPGYGLVAIMAGVIYGWLGLVPFYIGAVAGSVFTFWLFRKFASGYAHRLQEEHVRVAAVVRAVERRGFKLLFFIRLAPYPFSLMNAILAGSKGITFIAFFFSVALTVPKLAVNVALGAHLTDIADALIEHPSLGRWLMVAGAAAVSVVVFLVVAWLALKEIRLLEKEGVHGRRRRKKVGPSKGEFI